MDVLSNVAIPVASILIPTIIAIWLARSERKNAERARYLERRAVAAEPVILSLAQFISLDPLQESVQHHLRELRGRVAVYRATLAPDDALSGDWLALQHESGMLLWWSGMQAVDKTNDRSEEFVMGAFGAGRYWANNTLQTFSGWLAGHVADEILRSEGAKLMGKRSPSSGPSHSDFRGQL